MAVSRSVEDQTQREGHSPVIVFAPVRYNNEPRLLAGQTVADVVDGGVLQLFVQDDLVIFAINFY